MNQYLVANGRFESNLDRRAQNGRRLFDLGASSDGLADYTIHLFGFQGDGGQTAATNRHHLSAMRKQRSLFESTILVDYRVVDGWHVFTSKQVRGLYVANPDQRLAYEAIGPSIEKLLQLNEHVSASVRPALPLDEFLKISHEHVETAKIMPGTQQPFIVEKLAA